MPAESGSVELPGKPRAGVQSLLADRRRAFLDDSLQSQGEQEPGQQEEADQGD